MSMKHQSIEGLCPVLQLRQLADRIVIEYDIISAVTDAGSEIWKHMAPHVSDLFKVAAEIMQKEQRAELAREVKVIVDKAIAANIILDQPGSFSSLDLVADQLSHVPLYRLELALADANIRPLRIVPKTNLFEEE